MLVISKQSTAAGLVLEPRLEFLPARTVGAALGGFAHINKATGFLWSCWAGGGCGNSK